MKMKGKIFLGIMVLGIVLLVGAMLLKYSIFTYSTTDGTSIINPADNKVPPAPNKYLVSISAEDFNKEAHIIRQVEVKAGDVFTVVLDSNATTGFSWTEQAKIANGNILKQTEHAYVAPRGNEANNPVAGMSGIEEWWFTAAQTGSTTVTMSYDRPWEGGEKAVRTFVLTVVVK
jgi:predicted secreted protein